MRQRLINKSAPQETLQTKAASKGAKAVSRSAVVDEALSLQSLLFDSSISKEDWTEGLKYHSKALTNYLLNDQTKGFNQYLSS